MFAYSVNNPINTFDPLGLSEKDVVRILNEAQKFTDYLTNTGQRRDPGWLNNLEISCRALGICENDYNGCGGQSEALIYHLDNWIKSAGLDDQRVFEKKFRLPVHFNVEAGSSNPSDPTLILDPHANKFWREK